MIKKPLVPSELYDNNYYYLILIKMPSIKRKSLVIYYLIIQDNLIIN